MAGILFFVVQAASPGPKTIRATCEVDWGYETNPGRRNPFCILSNGQSEFGFAMTVPGLMRVSDTAISIEIGPKAPEKHLSCSPATFLLMATKQFVVGDLGPKCNDHLLSFPKLTLTVRSCCNEPF
jgi:hypothetical protein